MRIKLDNESHNRALVFRVRRADAVRSVAVVSAASLLLPILLSHQAARAFSLKIQTALQIVSPDRDRPSSRSASPQTQSGELGAAANSAGAKPQAEDPQPGPLPLLSAVRTVLVAPLLQFPTRSGREANPQQEQARPPSPPVAVGSVVERVRRAQESAQQANGAEDSSSDANGAAQTTAREPRRTVRILNAEGVRQSRNHAALTPTNEAIGAGAGLEPSKFRGAARALSGLARAPRRDPVPGSGLSLDEVTASFGYSSNAVPLRTGAVANNVANLGQDTDVGLSASLSYRAGKRGRSFVANYRPYLYQRNRLSEWSSLNHQLSLRYDQSLGRRWDFQAGLNGGHYGLEQVAIRAPVFRRVQAPVDFDSLLAAAGSGELTSDEFASLLTGAPVVEDPGGTDLGLARFGGASVNLGLSYKASVRTTLRFAAVGSVFSGSNFGLLSADINRLTSARNYGGSFAVDYKLRRGTTVTFEHRETAWRSNFWNANGHHTGGTFSQKFARRWRAGLTVGMNTFSGAVSGRRLANGGVFFSESGLRPGLWVSSSLDYAGRAHSFSVTGGTGQPNTLYAAQRNHSASARWTWSRPGSLWGVSSEFSYFALRQGVAFGSFEGSLANAGFFRQLGPALGFRADYFYGSFQSPYTGIVSNLRTHRSQVSLTWSPTSERR